MKSEDKKLKQEKVQGIYRRIKQQKSEGINDKKIGAVIVSICVFIWLLLLILNAFFDL
ncbi:hypothetical protein ACTHO0_21260 [Cytobacillus praedii]|uniref:hypothetical protein n=1 Tax=Cytobacillus praedii TaxID=1742358 RepID=UPI003F819ED1